MTQPAEVQPIALCSFGACEEPARFSYTWAWGETGFCCAKHQIMLAQRAQSLNRTIQFVALMPGTPEPMTRDERVRLHAEALAANEETAEVKARNVELYNANQELLKQVRHQAVQLSEALDQNADARGEIDRLIGELAEVRRDQVEKTNELIRLQALLHAGSVEPTLPRQG